jgi:hypothetical protein
MLNRLPPNVPLTSPRRLLALNCIQRSIQRHATARFKCCRRKVGEHGGYSGGFGRSGLAIEKPIWRAMISVR